MSNVGKTLVRGHTLLSEGAAFEAAACTEAPCGDWWRPDARGHAMCSCGATSPHLTSGGQRKRWHREHKAAVVAGAVEGGDGGGPA